MFGLVFDQIWCMGILRLCLGTFFSFPVITNFLGHAVKNKQKFLFSLFDLIINVVSKDLNKMC